MNTDLSAQDLRTLAAGALNNRFLTLSFPDGDAPYDVLLANRLEAEEFLSRDFRFVVEILSDNAKLDPKDFVGKLLSTRLLRNDGSFRYFNGFVFSFRLTKTDGGIAFYEAEVGPWLRYLTLRKNNRLFCDLTIRGQTEAIFQNYGYRAVWDWTVREDDPRMKMACQFEEHDHNYVHRRWEHLGLCYWYEHTAAAHKLIVSDPLRNEPAIDGSTPEIRYQSEAGSQEADGITSWSPVQTITSTHIALARADFKDPGRTAKSGGVTDAQVDGWENSGNPKLEWYEYAGAYGYRNTDDGQRWAQRRIDAFGANARQYEARGHCRFVMPGRWFRLTDHFGGMISRKSHEDEYLIVSARHVATNNYLQGVNAPATYENAFVCVRRDQRWRPAPGYNSVDTRILAPQTATVVAPQPVLDAKGDSIFTDEHGRCLVRFHWDREGQDTTWIRVSSGWAGGGQGMTALPRIGSEVVVQWLDGNPDHPIITGRVGNATNPPAWQLPHQRALTGIRSRELLGDGGNRSAGNSNHLVFDDTAGAIQTQLRSDHKASQLSLGSITRIEDWQGRQDARGEGFELRTDGVGAVRTAQGMVVSTEGRPLGKSHIADVSEPLTRLAKAQTLHDQLGKLAQKHDAQDTGADQSQVADELKSQTDGIKGSGGGNGSFAELNEPHLLLAGAAGLEMTTPATAHLAGDQHVGVTAGQHVSIAAGKSLFASVSDKFSVFVHRLGMKLIAASGKVQIQAQNDDLELLAKKVVAIISTTDWINITAKQGIRLTAGNSQLEVSAKGIVGYTPGENRIHAGSHDSVGPESVPSQFPGNDLCGQVASAAAQTGQASVALT
ncbi:type VI secretion system tip protein VgrG [Paraburkholderia sp. NMBU_R16]|uniref:type VI secretion system Vgr family protein n=1 Tax=Paraburkholderia sp. NMBU_R16 TaxID=2698676 RepID=UPI0015676F51|nr:type VI secretion system Vgr family protein [Paraburkholderia sp. NMBU_R16]NRO97046.1 type VI secretion system tip protein VgrG [Paraburkholderia sp. NMBU_R16]